MSLRDILLIGLVILVAFAFVALGLSGSPSICSAANGRCARSDDIAGLPLLAALGSIFLFLATPLTNSISRTTEHQADIFGLNAVRKPDAFASVMLKLSTYRKLEPGKWEEIVFYDHPSGRTRIDDRDALEEGTYRRSRHIARQRCAKQSSAR